jgi:peptidoglycan/xylan/chitin deacetylase (PgdA/CDA1 family)
MLYRDDDISVTTNIILLKKVHDIIVSRGKIHTVAVQMKDIWENKEVWYFLMTAKNLDVGLHGWTHRDYSKLSYDEIMRDIHESISYWESNILRGGYNKKEIKTFYPPWNRVSQDLERACKDMGLILDSRTIKTHPGEVYGFHYWTFTEQDSVDRLVSVL